MIGKKNFKILKKFIHPKKSKMEILHQGTQKAKPQLEKGLNDKKTYYNEILKNNLNLLTISDPKAQYSACALRVDIGSFLEPKKFPGLAHFLEHMLFLGSKKYPDPNEYNEFFGKYGGYNNAWTDDHYTTYVFDIGVQSKFVEALDRTANFFIEPLFDQKYVDKELNAVDSEYKEDFSDDQWRFWAVFNSLAHEQSEFKRFTLGNKETLGKEGVREELINFWKNNYSANLMHVVVYGKEDVEELRKWSIPILEKIENRGKNKMILEGYEVHYGESEREKYVMHKSIKDEYLLKFIWFLPACNVDSKNNSQALYLKYLLENEHKGSIHNILHQHKFIIGLCCQIHNQANAFSLLSLEIHLSEIGRKEIPTILEVVGAYVQMVKEKGPQEWFYQEIYNMSKIEFDYEPRIDEYSFVVNLISSFDLKETNLILKKGVYAEFDEESLDNFVKENLKFENLIIMHEGKDLDFEPNRHEKYFKIDFRVENFSEKFKSCLKSKKFFEMVDLPKPNSLIPHNLELYPDINITKKPVFLLNKENLIVFLRESQFKNPNCSLILNAYYNATEHSIKKSEEYAYSKIFVNYLDSMISDVIDEGLQISLNFSARVTEDSIRISISCFNDSLLRFLDLLDEKIQSIVPFQNEKQFLVSFNEYKSTVENEYKNEPSEIASGYSIELMYKRGRDIREMIQTVKNLEFSGFVKWVKNFYGKLFLDLLFVGNLDLKTCKESALKLKKLLKNFGNFQPLPIKEIQPQDVISFEEGVIDIFRTKIPCKTYKTSCLLLIIQIDPKIENSQHLSMLLSDIIKDNFYNKLRTEEQLGYSCSVNFSNTKGYSNIEFEIEGANHDPNYYSERIFKFLKDEFLFVKNLSEESLQKFKTASKKINGRYPYSINSACSKYYTQIHKKARFMSLEKERGILLKNIDKISKENLVEFYERNFLDEGKLRCLEIYAVSDGRWEGFLENLGKRVESGGVRVFESLEGFKEGKQVLKQKFGVEELIKVLEKEDCLIY